MAKKRKVNPMHLFKKRPRGLGIFLGFIAGFFAHQQLTLPPPIPLEESDYVDVRFSPKGGCTDAIVDEIHHARHRIDVYCFCFTSQPIAKALIQAHQRGVRIRVLTDGSEAGKPYSKIRDLYRAGIPVWIDKKGRGLSHSKTMLIDEDLVETGSFNYTKGAEEYNTENVVFIKNRALLLRYREDFDARIRRGVRY